MEHAELEQSIKGLGRALDNLREDLVKKFDTVEVRFSQMHEDLKGLRNVLIDVGKFDEWKSQHEKVTEGILRRLNNLEECVHDLEKHEIQNQVSTNQNSKLIWALIAAAAGSIGIAVGFIFHP